MITCEACGRLQTHRICNECFAVQNIKRAIKVPGPVPSHHRAVMERHRKEWPTLWAALDQLMKDA